MSNITTYIKDVVTISKQIDASVLVFTDEYVSAVNETQTIFLLQRDDLPQFPFTSLAVRDRVGEIYERLTAFEDIVVDFKTNQKNEVEEIQIKSASNKAKMNFKCIRKSIIDGSERNALESIKPRERPLKNIRLNETHSVHLTEKEVKTIVTADGMLKSSYISLNNGTDSMEIILVSENGEKFNMESEFPGLPMVSGTSPHFAHRYNTKDFLKLIKLFGKESFIIDEKGVVVFKAGSTRVLLTPVRNPV